MAKKKQHVVQIWNEEMKCPKHGKTRTTLICRHLLKGMATPWWPVEGTEYWSCPDCSRRHDRLDTPQERPDEFDTHEADIRVVCGECVKEARAKNTQSGEPRRLEAIRRPIQFLSFSGNRLPERWSSMSFAQRLKLVTRSF